MTEPRHDPSMQLDEDRLRTTLTAMAPAAPSAGVLERVRGRVERRRRRLRSIVALCALALATAGASLGLELSTGMPTALPPGPGRPVAPSTSTPVRSQAPTYSPVDGGSGSARGAPAPSPASCPPNKMAMADGHCGPVPGPGDGLGTDGLCTGKEDGPPCAAGVVPGHLYAYTVPGTCDGLMTFDGRQWVATLTLPNPVAPFSVWIVLDRQDFAHWIAPEGAVGLVPYTGQALGACHG